MKVGCQNVNEAVKDRSSITVRLTEFTIDNYTDSLIGDPRLRCESLAFRQIENVPAIIGVYRVPACGDALRMNHSTARGKNENLTCPVISVLK